MGLRAWLQGHIQMGRGIVIFVVKERAGKVVVESLRQLRVALIRLKQPLTGITREILKTYSASGSLRHGIMCVLLFANCQVYERVNPTISSYRTWIQHPAECLWN